MDLTAIPTVGVETALTIAAEIGPDLSRFPSSEHFCSWLTLAPGTRISGGKALKGRTASGSRAVRLAASTARHNRSFIGACTGRAFAGWTPRARSRPPRTNWPALLTRGEEYVEKGMEQSKPNAVTANSDISSVRRDASTSPWWRRNRPLDPTRCNHIRQINELRMFHTRGVWIRRYEHGWENYAFSEALPPMTPWAQARFRESRPVFGPDAVAVVETNDPTYQCLPPGVPRIYAHPTAFEIFQSADRVMIVYEFHQRFRHIYTDGRDHRAGRPVTWMGESVGHWDGDTLVVESVNFNDKTWIDRRGVPHSDQIHVMERFRRNGDGQLIVEITVEDPVAFTEPWTARRVFDSVNWRLEENVCMENSLFAEFSEYEREVLEYEGESGAR